RAALRVYHLPIEACRSRVERRLMGLWSQEERFGQRDNRPLQVQRLRELLNERLWRAGDERELDVLPVLADRVVDDRPGLQERGPRPRRKDDAVRRLPDRNFAD